MDFARSTYPEVEQLPEYWGLRWRKRGPETPSIFPARYVFGRTPQDFELAVVEDMEVARDLMSAIYRCNCSRIRQPPDWERSCKWL